MLSGGGATDGHVYRSRFDGSFDSHEVVQWGEGDEWREAEKRHDLQGSAAACVWVEGAVDGEHRRVALKEPLVWCIFGNLVLT